MDSFWFNSKYQKSLQITRDHANVWVEKMYKAYINLLTLIHNEGTQHIQQLLNEKRCSTTNERRTPYRGCKTHDPIIKKKEIF